LISSFVRFTDGLALRVTRSSRRERDLPNPGAGVDDEVAAADPFVASSILPITRRSPDAVALQVHRDVGISVIRDLCHIRSLLDSCPSTLASANLVPIMTSMQQPNWDELDLEALEKELRNTLPEAEAEKMIWAFERALSVARIDGDLLPTSRRGIALCAAEASTPRGCSRPISPLCLDEGARPLPSCSPSPPPGNRLIQ
jgi:hypothetical protein